MQFIESQFGGAPIKAWIEGVPVEDGCFTQMQNVSALPFVEHIALLPDCHIGVGSTIGSVVAMKGAIIPALVGVDIGCVDAETEYLSPTGWRKVSTYDGGDVLVYDPATQEANFEEPLAHIVRPSKGFHHIKTKYGIDQALSSDHRMLVYHSGRDRSYSKYGVVSAAAFAESHHAVVQGMGDRIKTAPETIRFEGKLDWTDEQLRAIVMSAADGHFVGPSVQFHFKKERKYVRALKLLTEASCEIVSNKEKDGEYHIRCRPVSPIKSLDQLWGCSVDQLSIVSEEVLYWDGNHDERCFYTRLKSEADFVQWAFLAAGKRAVLREDTHKSDGKIDYRVFAQDNIMVGVKSTPRTDIDFIQAEDGLEYCFTVRTGFFLIRRGGVTALTGNCGMVALKTTLKANDLPDDLATLRSLIEAAVPHGGLGPSSGWGGKVMPASVEARWQDSGLAARFELLCQKHPHLRDASSMVHLGSLGGGNHFIEICLDEDGNVWVMLHSGSRGIGNLIGRSFIAEAREMLGRRYGHAYLPDKDLAWFEEGEQAYADYVEAVAWGQDFAMQNREEMMSAVLTAMRTYFKSRRKTFSTSAKAINCHHNAVWQETHFGEAYNVTRKGAVPAGKGVMGIIPGSMGARSFIVEGLGQPESLCSCSHGAGRTMSRTAARKKFTLEDFAEQTKGVECRKDIEVIDEIPQAYKDIDAVMAAQADLVRPVAILKQLLCVKG